MTPAATPAKAPTMIDPANITGWVLAGGRGSRMGGVDKGLQLHAGVPLAVHAMRRLLPQVGSVAINANRQVDVYASFGVPVHADSLADHPGPLGGFLAGLEHCTRPYLMTVPCDAPNFPCDVVARLAAIAKTGVEERIFVRADKAVPYGRVAELTGMITAAGYKKIALVNEPEQKK